MSDLKNVLITAILKERMTSFDVILPSNPISLTLVNLTQQSLAWKLGLVTYGSLKFTMAYYILSNYTSLTLSICLVFIEAKIRFEKAGINFCAQHLLRRAWLIVFYAIWFIRHEAFYRWHLEIFWTTLIKGLLLMLVCCWFFQGK